MPELESWGGFFLGYFVADQLGNAYWWREWSGVEATTVHHVIGMVAYWRVLTGGFCHFLCGWLLEATTPFVNQRWFFAKAGWSGTLAYKAPSTRGRDAAQKLIRGRHTRALGERGRAGARLAGAALLLLMWALSTARESNAS